MNLQSLNKFIYFFFYCFSQAIETRHALHGVRWPTSNPKCLHVDFGTEQGLQQAIESTNEDLQKLERGKEKDFGWDKDAKDFYDKEKVILLI